MNPTLQRWVYTSFGLLWASGVAWLVLDLFFQTAGEFGTSPHPWQPPLLIVHGVAAVIAVFLFGWITGTHVGERLPRQVKRPSGLSLFIAVGVLAISGFANYYLSAESVRTGARLLHEIMGAAAILPMLLHWPIRERRRA